MYRCTCTHKERKLIILVLIHSIKLFMGKYLKGGDNYFLRLTHNKIDDNTVDTMCMSLYTISSIRKKFMEEGN